MVSYPIAHPNDFPSGPDMSSRTFTPVPKRVQDGSEESDIIPAAVVSGAPIELQARQVRYVFFHDTLTSPCPLF